MKVEHEGHYLKPNAEERTPIKGDLRDTETYISPNEQGEFTLCARAALTISAKRKVGRGKFQFLQKEEFWAYLDRHWRKEPAFT